MELSGAKAKRHRDSKKGLFKLPGLLARRKRCGVIQYVCVKIERLSQVALLAMKGTTGLGFIGQTVKSQKSVETKIDLFDSLCLTIFMNGFQAVKKIKRSGKEVEWGKCLTGEDLYTTELYECIGIAVCAPALPRTYLAHVLANQSSQDKLIPALVSDVQADTETYSKRLTVYVTGGDANSDSGSQFFLQQLELRDRAIKLLRPLLALSEYVFIEWNEEEGTGMDMQVDCQSTVCSVVRYYPGTVRNSALR